MALPVLICDDSNMARKQMQRALPAGFAADVTFAEHGADALEKIRAGKGDLLFLDLNMPVMDGYETLEIIQREQLNTMVIVVSGDIQPDAHKRVTALGAMAFIRKPIDVAEVENVLQCFGFYEPPEAEEGVSHDAAISDLPPALAEELPRARRRADLLTGPEIVLDAGLQDAYRELANVAMGQAGDLLARLLDVFIELPIPKVALLEASELDMTLSAVRDCEQLSAVCQGFIGAGVAGEAMVVFDDASFTDLARLMRHEGEVDDLVQLELLMDVTNVLVGAFLRGLSVQLDVAFSRGAPIVLGQHCNLDHLILAHTSHRRRKHLVMEIHYGIEAYRINCDLLLLFDGNSLARIHDRVRYLAA